MEKRHKSSVISFRWSDLAVPEVLTGVVKESDELVDDARESVVYDNLAIPEIHVSFGRGSFAGV